MSTSDTTNFDTINNNGRNMCFSQWKSIIAKCGVKPCVKFVKSKGTIQDHEELDKFNLCSKYSFITFKKCLKKYE